MGKKKTLYDDLKTGDIIRIGDKHYTLEVADTFFTRFKGLMLRKDIPLDSALLIKPCDSIHTFFMRFPMTAIFLDKNMRVTKVVPNMKPWRMTFAFGSYCVLELYGEEGSHVSKGDTLSEVYHHIQNEKNEDERQTELVPSIP